MKIRTRLLSALLTLVMVLSLIPALGIAAFAASITEIGSVTITGIVEPVAGEHPKFTKPQIAEAGATVSSVVWWDWTEQRNMRENDVFKSGQKYTVSVYVDPNSSYQFAANPACTINRRTADILSVDGIDTQRACRFTFDGVSEIDSGVVVDNDYTAILVPANEIDYVNILITEPAYGVEPSLTATPGADSFTVASVSWYPEDANYMADREYTVMINLEAKDSHQFAQTPTVKINGYYSAQVVSGGGSEELRVKATFPEMAPTVERINVAYHQNPVVVGVGQKAVLTVSVDADLQLLDNAVLQWYRTTSPYYGTGEPIPGATGLSYTAPTDQAGQTYYYFEISGSFMGTPLSSAYDQAEMVRVTVKEDLPVITRQPQSVEAKPGSSATFTVTATGKNLHYQWYGVDAGAPWTLGTDSPTLTIPNVDIVDSAYFSYWCVVSNDLGQVRSEQAKLSIAEKPYQFPFTDVPEDAWYYESVKAANKLGLINGTTATTYAPGNSMTYAEAIKLAACMHQLYTDGEVTLTNGSTKWYTTYYDYCLRNGIIIAETSAQEPGYDDLMHMAGERITRGWYALFFSRALPDEALPTVNDIPDESIPDVTVRMSLWGQGVYKLYRAGIVNGVDAKGTFLPENYIQRSEVAAILIRMMDETARVPAPSELGK